MPTIKFRIDSNGLMLSIAQALHEAADKIADTARIAAEGEKTIAEIKDLADKLGEINKQVSALQNTSLKVEVVNAPGVGPTAQTPPQGDSAGVSASSVEVAGQPIQPLSTNVSVADGKKARFSVRVDLSPAPLGRLPAVGEELVIYAHGHCVARGVIDTVAVDGRAGVIRIEGEEK